MKIFSESIKLTVGKSIRKYTQWHTTVNDPEGYYGLCYQKQRITNLVVLRQSSLDHPQRNTRQYRRQPEILQQAICWNITTSHMLESSNTSKLRSTEEYHSNTGSALRDDIKYHELPLCKDCRENVGPCCTTRISQTMLRRPVRRDVIS